MVDLIVVTAYFAVMLAVGWTARKGSPESYWVAERRYSTVPVAASLVATIFGASSTVGIIGLGYARGLTAGVGNITWYALTTPSDPYEQGLLFDDWTPKPAFYAYQTLTSELGGYEYVRTLNVPDVEGYVFQDLSLQEKTVAWGSGTLTFVPAGQLRVVDREGSVVSVVDGGEGDVDGVENGTVELQLSSEPVFVTVDN